MSSVQILVGKVTLRDVRPVLVGLVGLKFSVEDGLLSGNVGSVRCGKSAADAHCWLGASWRADVT
ncbi:hypothetical protein HG15A2_39600 [Adhaeretor mobilis]|uniref:Uncharacterized protein n=1 Tax=Adhaeretor mobilis TaxID=1930276 RepID=A0A517N0G2_9BACT|nr:hypothetical protein HG15A2_39600 [Adhaeretor mobilis]